MWYRAAADGVLVFHASFIAFVVLGLVTIWVGYFRGWTWTRRMGFRIAHLLAIGYVVLQSFVGMVCPLTDLENNLRVRGGQQAYSGAGFIADWLHRLIFFRAPSWVFTVCYTVFGLLVVGTMIFAPPQRKKKKDRTEDSPAQLVGEQGATRYTS